MSLKRISLTSLSVLALALGLVGTPFRSVLAVDSAKAPRPIPLTRPEMKEYLEDMKGRTLRIPLPELTDADKEKLGERGSSYESLLRYHYMPQSTGQGGTGGPGGQGRDEVRVAVASGATTIPTIRSTMPSRCSCSGSSRAPTTVSTVWAIRNRSCSARE